MEKEYSYKMKKEKIDQIRSKLFNSKLIHLPDNGGDCFETANVMRYINSVEAIISEQKAKIAELEKEVQIKQTAIDALLDHEF
jgi:hypothetical protein